MGKQTMRNIIFAALIAAPGLALAQDLNSRFEAVGACPGCELAASQSTSPTQLQRVPTSALPAVSRGLAAAISDYSMNIGRVETVNAVPFEDGQMARGQGNGVIISPCYMVTNFHGVYGETKTPDRSKDHSIDFFFGRGETSFRWKLNGRPVHSGVLTSTGAGDWALVKLDKCPGKKVGYPELDLRPAQNLQNESLTMVGIRPGQSNGAVATQTCVAQGRERTTGTLTHTCNTVDGLSAAGMFTNSGKLAGINVGVLGGQPAAVTMAEILADPQARALIQADKAQYAAELNLGPVHAALAAGRVVNL